MIDFPASPTDGQVFSATNGVVYKWSATYSSWLAQNPAPPIGGTGDFAASGSPATSGTAAVIIMPVTNGNSGGYYNATTGRWTPPSGRYSLYAGISAFSSGAAVFIQISLRKNGTTILTSQAHAPAAGLWGTVPIETQVDANGTDYFDLWGLANATGTLGYFGAFPLTGITGAPGAPGASGSLVTNPLWQMVSETILSSNTSLLTVTVPAGAKQFQIDYEFGLVGGSNDTGLFNCVQSGVAYTTADHNSQQLYASGAAAAGAVLTGQTGFSMGGGVFWQGRITGSLQTNAGRSTFLASLSGSYLQAAARVANTYEYDNGCPRSGVTGFQFRTSVTSLLAGSVARVSVLQ